MSNCTRKISLHAFKLVIVIAVNCKISLYFTTRIDKDNNLIKIITFIFNFIESIKIANCAFLDQNFPLRKRFYLLTYIIIYMYIYVCIYIGLYIVTLTHLCRPVRSTFAVRETASLA